MKNLLLILALFVVSCASLLGISNTITTEVDPFTGDTVSFTNKSCGNNFCTRFKIINKKTSFLYATYQANDWLFVESIQMKIKNTDKQIKLNGTFERDIGYVSAYGSLVEEKLTVKVDEELREFIKSSLGKTVIVRFNGKAYVDREFPVGVDGQWNMFLENSSG